MLRTGLAAGGLAVASRLAVGRAATPAAAGAAPDPFVHGVASGDPAPDRVRLWSHVTTPDPGPVPIGWVVAADPELRDVVASGEALAGADTGHTVHVEVDALPAGRTWWARFDLGGTTSPVVRARTTTDPSDRPAATARLAFASCANLESGWFNGYAALAGEELDAVVHLGDYIYEYGEDVNARPPVPGRGFTPRIECVGTGDYRQRYAQYRLDPDLRRLHSRHPVVAIWDDHEFANNAWRDGAESHDPFVDGGWEARQAAASSAWREWLPAALPDPATPDRIWRACTIGGLVEVLLLDVRRWRARPGNASEPGRPDDLLGAAQLAWLTERLAHPVTPWIVVASPVALGPRRRADGRPLSGDTWDGFPSAAATVLDAIASSPATVVVASGDAHASWAADLPDGAGAELLVPSITSRAPAEGATDAEHRAACAGLVAANPGCRFVDLRQHGAVILDVTPGRLTATWKAVDRIDRPSDGWSTMTALALGIGDRRWRAVGQPDRSGNPSV